MNRRPVLFLLSLGVAAIAVGALLARMLGGGSVPLDSGTWLPQPRALAEFHLQDLSGREFDLEQSARPSDLAVLRLHQLPRCLPDDARDARAGAAPGPAGRRPGCLRERGSGARQRRSAAGSTWAPSTAHFIGVRGERAALAPLLRSLSAIAVREDLPGGSYTMDHSATLYLLDTRGRLVAVFSPPFSAPRLAADLHQVAQPPPDGSMKRAVRRAAVPAAASSVVPARLRADAQPRTLAQESADRAPSCAATGLRWPTRSSPSRALRELQRLLYARPAPRRAPGRCRGAGASPPRATARSASPEACTARPCCRPRATSTRSRRCWPGSAEWAARLGGGLYATLYLAPLQLPSRSHAARGPAACGLARPRPPVLGQSRHRSQRARPVRAQRAGRLRLRGAAARLRWCWWVRCSSAA